MADKIENREVVEVMVGSRAIKGSIQIVEMRYSGIRIPTVLTWRQLADGLEPQGSQKASLLMERESRAARAQDVEEALRLGSAESCDLSLLREADKLADKIKEEGKNMLYFFEKGEFKLV